MAISARQVELVRDAGALAQLAVFHLAVLGSVTRGAATSRGPHR